MKKLITILLALCIATTCYASSWRKVKTQAFYDIDSDGAGVWTNVSCDITGRPYVEMIGRVYVTGEKVPLHLSEHGEVIQQDHFMHAVIEGTAFSCAMTCDVTGNGMVDYLVVVPATGNYHMQFYGASESEGSWTLFEGAVIDPARYGPQKTCGNNDRNSATTANLTVYTSPDFDTSQNDREGTAILVRKTGSGRAVGGEATSLSSILLKNSTKYIFRMSNDTALDNWSATQLHWHEE